MFTGHQGPNGNALRLLTQGSLVRFPRSTSHSDETLNRGPRLRISFLYWWDVKPSSLTHSSVTRTGFIFCKSLNRVTGRSRLIIVQIAPAGTFCAWSLTHALHYHQFEILFSENLWGCGIVKACTVHVHTVNSRYLEVVGTIFYKFKLPKVQINLHFG